jgi:uncharacterized membrane protein YiaA
MISEVKGEVKMMYDSGLFVVLMTVSGTFFSISILILSTLRFGISMDVVKERLDSKQYDRLYDGMFLSVISGFLALVLGVSAALTKSDCVFYASLSFFLIQMILAAVFAFLTFYPPKFFGRGLGKKEKEDYSPGALFVDIFESLLKTIKKHVK